MLSEKVAEELKKIEKTSGLLNAQEVVDSARPASSSLHGFFEWDDEVAANKFRLNQARVLVRNIKLKVIDPDSNRTLYITFISMKTAPDIGR
jgi:hypothetical protein